MCSKLIVSFVRAIQIRACRFVWFSLRKVVLNVWQYNRATMQLSIVKHHRTTKCRLCFSRWTITSWHRSIHKDSTHLFCSNCHFFWDSRVNGGGVNQQGSLLHLPKKSKAKSMQHLVLQLCILFIKRWGGLDEKSQIETGVVKFAYLRIPFGPV